MEAVNTTNLLDEHGTHFNKKFKQETAYRPCIQPLKTLSEIQIWKPGEVSFSSSRCLLHLQLRTNAPANTPKTLFCHDLTGCYHDDRFIQGSSSTDNYAFYNWQYVDMFIYFSHHFITIPPVGWVSAAHRHGLPVLGTIITEQEVGKNLCVEMLSDKSCYSGIVNKLVDIAEYYNFDGWLINIENEIPVDLVDNLVDFVRQLKIGVGERLKHGHVMWYDSVTNTGHLVWQNALNQQNQKFFDVADSIYLNYTWTSDDLDKTATLATSLERFGDVYVGVDVFGRGMMGGGGYNTNLVMESIRKCNLSAVLFAPSWTWEKNDQSNFTQNEYRFWEKLHDLCPQHGPASLPLSSHFCRGLGKEFYYHGQVVSSQPWYNLSLQSLQPSYNQTQFRHHHHTPVMMEYHTDEAFLGGGCLRLSSPITPDGQATMFKLFACDIALTESLFISYTTKCNDVTDVFLNVTLAKDGVTRTLTLLEHDPGADTSGVNTSGTDTSGTDTSGVNTSGADSGGRVVQALDVESASDVLGAYTYWMCMVGQQQWVTRCFVLEKADIDGWCVTCISVGLHQKMSVQCPTYDNSCSDMCGALIGQIQMNPVSMFSQHPPTLTDIRFTPDTHSKSQPISGWLSWSCDQSNLIDFCNIYIYFGLNLDNLTLLGQSSTGSYRVSDIDFSTSRDISFLPQPVLFSGFVESISMCESVSLDVDITNGAD